MARYVCPAEIVTALRTATTEAERGVARVQLVEWLASIRMGLTHKDRVFMPEPEAGRWMEEWKPPRKPLPASVGH